MVVAHFFDLGVTMLAIQAAERRVGIEGGFLDRIRGIEHPLPRVDGIQTRTPTI